jgi:diguanylate cyclase
VRDLGTVPRRYVDEQERRASRERRDQLLALRPKRDLVFAAQPIHDLRGDHPRSHVVGFELLARFPTLGEGPLEVFADAWRLGVGPALELATIELALEAMRVLPDGMHLALNLSPDTLADDRATAALRTAPPGRLVVELTEHARVADYRRLRAAIDRLRGRGVRVAVDDVGTGFSGLHRIVELEPDVLKVDGALVRGVDHRPARRAMVAAVVAFAAEVGATVVAEQVETDEELTTLRRLGVAFAQGFILGRPARLTGHAPVGRGADDTDLR